jgi:hypothetical protein
MRDSRFLRGLARCTEEPWHLPFYRQLQMLATPNNQLIQKAMRS